MGARSRRGNSPSRLVGSLVGAWYKPPVLEFRLLGPLEVREGERSIALPRQKQRALLGALLLRAGQVVPKDRLVDDLWGERAPRRAESALHNYVSQLRQALGRDVVVTTPPGYLLRVAPEQVDILRFERLVAEGRAAGPRERMEKLRQALSLVRGPPLTDLRFELFAQAEILRLEELELSVHGELHEAELELGHHADVVPPLEALVAAHPYREHLRAQLMLALYRSGRQADALAAYQDGRSVLVEELGIEPGQALQELERAILRQDPALHLPRIEVAEKREPEPQKPETTSTLPGRRPARKTVTVLFTALAHESYLQPPDPESLRATTDRFLAAASTTVERHGGTVERLGEDLTAVFGVPAVHEDDALRAVRAAVDLRERLDAAGMVSRTGVTTGEVFVAGEAERMSTTGAAVSLAARLMEAAAPHEILLAVETRHLLKDSVTVEQLAIPDRGSVLDKPAFRLIELHPGAGGRSLRLDSPMVGRERPLAALGNAFASAVADRKCHLFTVLGEAGVGKSRLVLEFVDGLGDGATATRGRCLPYGASLAFSPLVEAVRSSGAAERADELEIAGPTDETFSAARRLLESLARNGPLVVAFDDVQWAEPSFLDLVENVVERSRNAPILIICVARPELHDTRPSWGGGKPNAGSVLLEPLTPVESERLIDGLLGESDLPQPVRDHIVGASEGNPLFLEELLAMLVDRAVLRREGDRWTTEELPVLAIPPTIHALIAARIDRLADQERIVLELASIEGKVFRRATVEELAPEHLEDGMEGLLGTLVRRELIRPVSPDEDVFTFRHQLVCDATYEAIPKRSRAALHERFAALVSSEGRVEMGVDELLGFHLEMAYRYALELGETDDHARTLAADAAEHLAAAARNASSRGDEKAAAGLRDRVTELRSG